MTWIRTDASALDVDDTRTMTWIRTDERLDGQQITPTHRPEDRGTLFSGLWNSLTPSECSWGPLLKSASGSSSSFIERRGTGGGWMH